MCYCLLEGHNIEFVSTTKTTASAVPTVIHSPNPPLRQDESKTILGPDTCHAHPSNVQVPLRTLSNSATECQRDIVTR